MVEVGVGRFFRGHFKNTNPPRKYSAAVGYKATMERIRAVLSRCSGWENSAPMDIGSAKKSVASEHSSE